jgi:hypothetical protein
LPLKCAVISLYSFVKQRLKCNTGKVGNCLIQVLLAMVLSIEEHVFLVEYIFRESSRYTDLVQQKFAEKFPETSLPHRKAVRRITEKFRETGSVLDAERSGRPSKLNDKKSMYLYGSMLRSPLKSLRKLALRERYQACNSALSGPRKTEPLPIQSNKVIRFRPV